MRIAYLLLSIVCAFISNAQTELVASEDTALVHISVTDKKGIPEENAKVFVTSLDGQVHKETTTDISGKFDMLLPEGKKYKIVVKKFGKEFIFDKTHQIMEIPQHDGETEFDQAIVIFVITDYSKVFTLDVHFESGKWELTENAKKTIDGTIYNQMIINKNLIIEIAGHTDNVGDDAHNMKLSQLRANAVRDYIYSKGIAHNRVIAKGYGETHPLAPNDSEAGRLQNRRIEVKVIAE